MQESTQYHDQFQHQQMLYQQAHIRALQEMAARQQAMSEMGKQADRQQMAEQTGNSYNNGQLEMLRQQNQTHFSSASEFSMRDQNTLMTFHTICQNGSASEVEQILSTTQQNKQILAFGLESALSAANISVAKLLLSKEAPILPSTAEKVLQTISSPTDFQEQIALFELLTHHGWNPNTPGSNGAPLLAKVATRTPLLRWFLMNGANPNFGIKRHTRNGTMTENELGYESCAALEAASAKGDLEAVQILFEAGAEIQFGYPLHYAAGAFQTDDQTLNGPSSDADVDRIPVMQLLLERGADINQKGETELVAHHPIMYAVMAGAVERVRWLLEHGADPDARGSWGSAAESAFVMGSDEMKVVMEVGIRARRRGGSASFVGESLAIRLKPTSTFG
ncbi:hypothetical protein PENSTE_c006G10048 [Penicillium steckii]|uniref:Uncharacterized protein n=1 Tax=Penicillium steckii TaxID=303698 RepID=A0A1V6TGB8_9EURO|nr:hypothetical protein PENSTE_c006G10048 [Penicillium steckii]